MVENAAFDWKEDEHRTMMRDIMMTVCDIGSITKAWEVQRKVSVSSAGWRRL